MSWTHIEDTRPRARKEYRCHLCGYPIPVGLRHVKRFGANDSGLVSIRMHDQCEAATRGWDEQDWECDEWTFCHEELTPLALAEVRALAGIAATETPKREDADHG